MKGSIRDKKDNSTVPYVVIVSTATGASTSADSSGNFSLLVGNKDTLVMRRVGYMPSRVYFDYKLVNGRQTFFLEKIVQNLQNVSVGGSRDFKKDSLQFRQENSGLFNKKRTSSPPSINKKASDNYGQLTLTAKVSPSALYKRYLSGQEKRERRFKTVLESQEKDNFVDSRYTPKLVRSVLNNDTLDVDNFMLKFRPTFDFVKKASEYDMAEYILTSYAAYKKEQEKSPKQPTQ